MEIKKVAVCYGGVSPEHEVAVITALQVMEALKKVGYEVLPIYINKKGNWIKGDDSFLKPEFYKDLERVGKSGKAMVVPANREFLTLEKNWWGFGGMDNQIDVIFPVFHGKGGEDGTIQGLLELANIPYVGSGVEASAVGMDKYLSKCVANSVGLRTARGVLVVKGEKVNLGELKYPMFVKPANLGSSIGVSKVKNKKELDQALEVAWCYDRRVLVEEAVDMKMEVNISVMGDGDYRVSVTEQPKASAGVLSFEDKYLGQAKSEGMAGAKRLIPAPIREVEKKEIEKAATNFFRAINGKGLARVDFMIDKGGRIYFNEINTLPGSMAFYLWDKSGYPFPKLVKELVEMAYRDWESKQELITSFDSNILANFEKGRGLKGKA